MILVACGLKSEARIAVGDAADDLVRVVAGGGDADRLAAKLSGLAPGARGILSFGIAGGLAPGLAAGDLRVAAEVISPDGTRYDADLAWAAAIVARLGCPAPVRFACVEAVVTEPFGKATLHRATGAALVDMESSIAARVAGEHGLPFAALRAVTDSEQCALPPAVSVSMKPGGDIDLPAILWSVARAPGQIPGLIRTGRDSRKAFAALLRGRQLLGPGFALFDLA